MSDFFSEEKIDPNVDRMLAEVATRESYHLFGKVFDVLEKDVYKKLCTSDGAHQSLLEVWAYAKVIRDIQKRMKHHKHKLKKDKPITISAGKA